jgi:hypothetical protein
LLIGLALLVSCGSPQSPLTQARESPRAVAEAVLAAVAAQDAASLRALAVTEPEFRQHVWPELPASRPERNLPFSYVWGDLRQKSETRLAAALAAHGGQQYTLEEVRFSGETRYPGYTVHRGSLFLVRGPDGPRELRLCGSMIEKDGRWKVFSYIVDD